MQQMRDFKFPDSSAFGGAILNVNIILAVLDVLPSREFPLSKRVRLFVQRYHARNFEIISKFCEFSGLLSPIGTAETVEFSERLCRSNDEDSTFWGKDGIHFQLSTLKWLAESDDRNRILLKFSIDNLASLIEETRPILLHNLRETILACCWMRAVFIHDNALTSMAHLASFKSLRTGVDLLCAGLPPGFPDYQQLLRFVISSPVVADAWPVVLAEIQQELGILESFAD